MDTERLRQWLVGKFFVMDDDDTVYDDDDRFHWRATKIHDVVVVGTEVWILASWSETSGRRYVRKWTVTEGCALHDNLADASMEASEFNTRDNKLRARAA